ncbi:muscarinic acetylcholine receptor M4 [Hypomesus transpacificus]|uniref:muscarinic acetylcholine receptor M4 n=1 Tax=Hypomesus transpacificus TaxID=137520 RepID=UPI001F08009F|nr:muscarinic acetylcholine receptor M4 [Hypomesus transpacificus]
MSVDWTSHQRSLSDSEPSSMDGRQAETGELSLNFSTKDPNTSWVGSCGNGSCRSSWRPGCSYGTAGLVLIAVFTASLSILTVLGNALVMLSITVNKQLQTINNYFLFSLACADLIIGLLPMNLYSLYLIMGYWPMGAVVCDLWLALDYAVSNASVMNLLLISFDRYYCVTQPLVYPARRSPRVARGMIAAAWLLSFFLWVPIILLWQHLHHTLPEGKCYILLLASPTVTLATTLPSFYLPAAIMIVLYTRISLASRSRLAELRLEGRKRGTSSGGCRRGTRRKGGAVSSEMERDWDKVHEVASVEVETSVGPKQDARLSNAPLDCTGEAKIETTSDIPHAALSPRETTPDATLSPRETTPDATLSPRETTPDATLSPRETRAVFSHPTTVVQPRPPHNDSCGSEALQALPRSSRSQAKTRRRVGVRERKVTRTVLAILLVFLLTWTPYSVMAVIGTFCHYCVPDTMWTLGYWLCYINSTINPACYALCNPTFRRTFRNLLRCRCRNMGRMCR